MENEIWKSCFIKHYFVSNLGNIKRQNYLVETTRGIRYIKEKILKGNCDKSGYKKVHIKGRNYLVHRLIAKAFINNPNNLPQVNHINGVRNDNKLSNLEWVSGRENLCHAQKLGDKSTTGYRGVSKNRKRFIAHIYHEGKAICIGSFPDADSAFQARVNYEKEKNIVNKYLK